MPSKITKILGYLYVVIGLGCNIWVLALVSEDKNIGSITSQSLIWLFDVSAVALGLFLITTRNAKLAQNINVSVLSGFVLVPLVSEAFFRAGIALGWKKLQNPGLYADYFTDSNYWKLNYIWKGRQNVEFIERIHPRFGWAQSKVTENNPLGLEEVALTRMKSEKPKILFYGDSFVKGSADKNFQIPEYLASKIPEMNVVDLGVGGYGTDQIFLLFEETHRLASDALVLVGFLTGDIERAVLHFRTAQKPYFELSGDDDLTLKGIPIFKDQKQYLMENPPSIKSYFVSFLSLLTAINRGAKSNFYIREINSRIIDRFKTRCDQAHMKLIFVLFYPNYDLTHLTWREEFIKEKLSSLNIPFIETKNLLLSFAENNHLKTASFYAPVGGHHNNLGNQVIAEAIINYLRRENLIHGGKGKWTQEAARIELPSVKTG